MSMDVDYERERADREKDRADKLLEGYVKTQEQAAELEAENARLLSMDRNFKATVDALSSRLASFELALKQIAGVDGYGGSLAAEDSEYLARQALGREQG